MAIDYDISDLLGKTENDGSTDAGRLTAKEWNSLVEAVQGNQRAVNGAIKSINYNGTDYTDVRDGVLYMTVLSETGRNVKFQWLQKPTEVISKGGACNIEFNIIDQKKDDDDASVLIPYQNPGKVNFYVDEKLVGTVNNVYDSQSDRYTGPVKFDFSKAATLSTKSDGNSLKVEYVNSGVTINEYFNVRVLDLSITVDNFENVYTTDNLPSAKVTVSGADCLLYASVDDKTPYLLNGVEVRNGIPKTISNEFAEGNHNTHGTHTLKIWAQPVGYEDVTTDVLSFNYIFGSTSNSNPIVMSTITDGSEFELYGKMEVEYVAFVAGENGNRDIAINITDSNNKTYLSTTQSVSFVNGKGTNKFLFTLFPVGNDVLTGDKKLVIGISDSEGNIAYRHTTDIIINESTVSLTHAEGYVVYLSANGRSNSESNETKKVWSCVSDDESKTTTSVTFDDNIEFLDTGSGWIADADGNTAMHLKKGRFFTLNHKPFKWNPTYKNDANGNGNGLTISIEFATRNCLNANAKVIDCMDYTQEETGRGFYVTASSMKLLGNDVELQSKFREDTRIKLDIVIEGKLNKYLYDTVVGTDPTASDYFQKGESDECLAIVFVDGVYNGITLIGKNTSFQQGSSVIPAQDIRFGSDECDLDIYNIRIYDRALTFNEIVKNYSYDTPKFEDKVAIAQRNDIFSTANNNMPTLDVGKLRKARPELPFIYVELDPAVDKLPQNKSDWKFLTMTKFQNPMRESGLAEEAITSWESNTGVLRNQGTSSMTYPWPWRNWDWKTGDSDYTSDKKKMLYYFPTIANTKETGSKWHQFDYTGSGDNLPIKKITLKKDYASSEMCNNAICSDFFTDMALGIAKSYPKAVSPSMRADIEANSTTDFKLALKATPAFMFHTLKDPNTEGTAGLGVDGMGMMNIIPNKNEVGYLGFKKNKWENSKDGATEREQSWELGDNLDDVFWVKKLDHFNRNADGTFKNSIKDLYEARTPKDSSVDWGSSEADFGMTPKGKDTIEYDQAQGVYDEQYDIVEFHNWLVSTNQFLATGEELKGSREPWNDNGAGAAKYTHDTKEYRKAKFAAEANDRLLLDQWILYYIWREQFWMFDSGFKNLQVYTVGPNPENPTSSVMQWGCMVRDADTALGIENTGKDYFPPHIEDTDYYTENDGKITFHYGGAKGIYDITELQAKKGGNAKAVLNGQFGSVWVNIRECFGSEIGAMYRALCNNASVTNFGAELAINKFRSHQEKWCENLYNFGMRQYFGGAPFSAWNKSALGDKKNSRAQWLDRGFYYRRGKYQNLSDNSAFRINTYPTPDEVTPELRVKSYIPMYLGAGGTTAEMINSKNVIRLVDDTYEDGSYGKPISIGEDGFNFPNTGDAVSYIYGTSMLTDIGDLARVCKLLRVQTMSFPKLRQLNLGHEKARDGITYREYATKYIINDKGEQVVDPDAPQGEPREFRNEILPNLDCSSLTQLTLLDVTNHTNLSDLNIKKCDQLQELYARGTILKSIDLPATTSLKKIYLGSELTSLSLVDLTGIEEFVIEGLSNCGRLVINNCGSYMAAESYKITQMALPKLETVYDPVTNPSVVSLRGINWENADQKMLESLLNIDADLTGYIKVGALSNDLKIRLINRYGNIDNPKNSLYIEYRQVAITKISMPVKQYIFAEGDHQMAFTVEPSGANTYKSATWTLGGAAAKYATINAETGVITRNNVPADESISAELKVVVKQMPKADGSERADLTATSTIYFYNRIARPGDIVYSDGSFSEEYDKAKSPVGVCYYVDPTDPNKRLMCALKPLNLNAGDIRDHIPFGVSAGDITTNSSGVTSYWGASPNLSIESDPSYNCYDIEAIPNYSTNGTPFDTFSQDTEWFSDEVYRDVNNESNGYFKEFKKTTYYGDLGWKTAYKDIEVDNVLEDEGKTVRNITINSGDSVPSGWYNTLAIIEHRNRLIDEYSDDTRNPENSFRRPACSEFWDEYYDLEDLMKKAATWYYEERDPNIAATHGELLYYPAASACFAYEPEITNLNDKFKVHNWFLPSSGDIARICYYIFQSHIKGTSTPAETPYLSQFSAEAGYKEPANAFYNVFINGVMNAENVRSNTYVTSTERDGNNAISLSMYENQFSKYGRMSDSTGKYVQSMRVLPVCAF